MNHESVGIQKQYNPDGSLRREEFLDVTFELMAHICVDRFADTFPEYTLETYKDFFAGEYDKAENSPAAQTGASPTMAKPRGILLIFLAKLKYLDKNVLKLHFYQDIFAILSHFYI